MGLADIHREDDVSLPDTPVTREPDTSKWGTSEQTEIIEDYDMTTEEQKLLVPYIEKVNGNLCVAKGDFEDAVKHYN